MREDLHAMLAKEVNRRDFLKHVGLTIAALTGAVAAMRTLTSFGSQTRTSGFGSGVYGGPKIR